MLFEDILDRLGVAPIVGVIPNNQDPAIQFPAELDIWEAVRRWQKKSWHIAFHGFDHRYHKIKPADSIIPLSDKSEFVGLSLDVQVEKIRHGNKIFQENGVDPKIFMAPSHTLDHNTLKALRLESDIKTITDGLSLRPYTRYGFDWIPQQMWRFRNPPLGQWCVCYHPNEMSNIQIGELDALFNRNKKSIKSLESISPVPYSFGDLVMEKLFYLVWLLKRKLD